MRARTGRRGLLAGAALVLLSCLALAGVSPASANDGRRASFVIDANTGRVLHAHAADAPRYPASLTKVMTLYLVFELLEAGKLSLDTPIRISAQAASVAPSKLDLDVGDTIPLGAAIRALVTKSANDVAVAIAEHIAGSEAAFARAMTAKARQLGMHSTTFRNPHGLPDSEQVTTARDMATLGLAMYDHFPRHARVFATQRFTYAGASYRNHNTLLGNFSGMEGIKTGYTRASGFNLLASVRRDGHHVVAVVLGGSTAASRNAEMRALLTRALSRASTAKTRRPLPLPRSEPAIAAATSPARSARAMPTATRHAARATAPAPRLIEPPTLATPPQTIAALPQSQAQSEPPIVMARVRSVPIVSRAPAQAASSERTDELPPPPMYVPPYGDRRQAEAPRPWYHTPAAAPAAPVSAPAPVLREPPRQVTRASYVLPDTGRGARPSTLSAQAARLEQGAPAVYAANSDTRPSYVGALPSRGPVQPAPIARGDYAVQVGAFATAAEAEERLRAIRQATGRVLDGASNLTEPVSQGSRTLYRARFAGLEAASANQACNAMKRQRVDCFVARIR